jgi:hypothetical protein
VADPVKVTATGAVPFCVLAVAVTCGRALVDTPLPMKSTQLTLNRLPVPVSPAGLRAMKNSGPSVAAVIGTVTSVYVCQAPVLPTVAVASRGPAVEPVRISIRPPAEADATRNRIWLMLVRFAGLIDHQSPSSMKPMFWKPPAVSLVVSRCTPGSPPPTASIVRPVSE